MDAEVIKRALERLENLPVRVAEWQVEIGEDASGDVAVWVWAKLADTHVDSEVRQTVREVVRRAAQNEAAASPQPWVYVRVLERAEEPTK